MIGGYWMAVCMYVVLGLIAVLTVCLVFGATKLERRQQDWEWLHPPNDDGITLLEDIDNADSRKSP